MEKLNINGNVYDVYTEQDWETDRVLKVQVGQLIEPSVFYQLRDCVPPQTYGRGFFQPGEADSHDWTTGRPLYQTFESMGCNYWKYVGLQTAK